MKAALLQMSVSESKQQNIEKAISFLEQSKKNVLTLQYYQKCFAALMLQKNSLYMQNNKGTQYGKHFLKQLKT